MITYILLVHVLLAVMSLGYAGGVILASKKQKLDKALSRTKIMWCGTIATTGSGVLLTFITRSSIGRFCSTLLSFLVVVLAAHYYQRNVRQKLAAESLNRFSS